MQNSALRGSGVTRSARPILTGLTVLTAFLNAKVARADWGDDWGTMLWGSRVRPPIQVPGLDDWGLLLLAVTLGTAALLMIGKRRAPRTTLVMFVALVLPLAAYATTISMPYVFVNGTPADATQVNQNLDVLVTESNDQDLRLTVVEGLAGPHTHPGGDITSQVGDADTVDGLHATALEESAEIDADIAAHAISTSAHHTRYSDAEAFAAAAGVDAGTLDGIDSIALEESAEIDADIAAHSLVPAAHHSRYSDAEALVAAAGVDAGTLDGLDSTDFAGASHTHSYGNVAIVAQSGGAYTDPKSAMDDLATWCGTPSASNPCLVRLMPGSYDLGNNALTLQPYVDIEGSGESTTTVTSTHSSGSFNENSATLVGASNAEVRFLSVENQGGAAVSIAVFNPSGSATKITHVTATASGGTTNCYGMINNPGSSPILTNVESTASGANQSVGIDNNLGSSAIMTNVYAEGAGGANWNYGVGNSTASPIMTNVTAVASGGSNARGVVNSSSASVMTNVTATASGATTTNYGVYNLNTGSGPVVMTNVTATGSGGTTNEGVYNSSSTPTLRGVSSNGVQVYSAGEYRFDSPVTIDHYLHPSDFTGPPGGGYAINSEFPPVAGLLTTSSGITIAAPIRLPNGADLTGVTCYYVDDSLVAEFVHFEQSIWVMPISGSTGSSLGWKGTNPADFDDATVRSLALTPISGTGDPVDNSAFIYGLQVGLTVSASNQYDVNFRGCRISYELATIGFR